MRECRGCGAELVKRHQQVYCSVRCQRELERRANVARWLETGTCNPATSRGHYVRTYINDEQGGRCAICLAPATWNGLPLAFVLDHVDGDSGNNHRDNLRLVCPNCDSQLPTFKMRNKGKGRHSRRERYADGRSY
ncbi:HNH endonuclease [Nocardioides sp. YIM 123512]|uniref:HNH endonuclease n=1 Tax=Nocardioides flavescens TaxID=2691959 RepID=A0A6L7F2I1_9ACTN|nr:HNH endonuclease [Nocardioides flavescens]